MARSPNHRELVLDHGRVFVEVPGLMTDEELAAVFEAFVKEVRGRATKAPPEPAEPSQRQPFTAASVSKEAPITAHDVAPRLASRGRRVG